MKNQALFSAKDKNNKLKCRLLQFLFGALRVKKTPLVHLSWQSGNNLNTVFKTNSPRRAQ